MEAQLQLHTHTHKKSPDGIFAKFADKCPPSLFLAAPPPHSVLFIQAKFPSLNRIPDCTKMAHQYWKSHTTIGLGRAHFFVACTGHRLAVLWPVLAMGLLNVLQASAGRYLWQIFCHFCLFLTIFSAQGPIF